MSGAPFGPKSKLLVHVELPEPPAISQDLVEVIASLNVVLLGWYNVPEQTSPEQARDQFEDEAQAALDEVAAAFREAGTEVETKLVFTPDPIETIERINEEEWCDAILIARPMYELERILVPRLGADIDTKRVARFVAWLAQGTRAAITLVAVAEEETEEEAAAASIDEMADRLMEQGVEEHRLSREVRSADDPSDVLGEVAGEHSLVVLGALEPTLLEKAFGTVPERLAEAADVPIIVVRRATDNDGASEEATASVEE